MKEERDRAAVAVVNSDSPKRLIVSGPGTGKSFAFEAALTRASSDAGGEQGLALTFLRKLADELANDLGDTGADVNSLHGYCRHLMHKHLAGLRDADIYAGLMEFIVVNDLRVTGKRDTNKAEIDEHLDALDTSDGLIDDVISVADYYTAVGFPDLVYRVLRHFEASPEAIPAFPLVVVDEYQDFSLLETTFIDLLATTSPVLIAGDDDQALYTELRHASPQFIRDLATGGVYERYELPYCSRCIEVVVAAVKDVIKTAVENGHLVDRLDKPFQCYLPEKRPASEANPRLIRVNCSTANQPYAGRYIAQQIARIPEADIVEARDKKRPAALIIGPSPFLASAFKEVRKEFPHARMKDREPFTLNPLDGYERIAKDRRSRLGWRIIVAWAPSDGWDESVRQALDENFDLIDLLPPGYVEDHLRVADLVERLINDGGLPRDDEELLCEAVGQTIDQMKTKLAVEDVEEEPEVQIGGEAEEEAAADILFTSLVGAKGLSAEHVFITGLNNGHFPRNAGAITDEEVCRFIVALSRTRKRCHLIQHGVFFARGLKPWEAGLKPSEFLSWVGSHVEEVEVNKDYDFSA